jgi:putative MATE family efflux protein
MNETRRELLKIALPAVAGFISLILYQFVDIFWIAKLGTESVAGAASSDYWMWALEAMMETTTIGCATMVAQSLGAGDKRGARDAAREAAHLSVVFSICFTILGLTVGEGLLRWMGLSPAALEAGWAYFRILVCSLPILHLIILGNQIFNANADTKTVVVIMGVALTFNACLDPILMFGWLGFPAFGIRGAAYATVSGWILGLILRVIFLRRRGYIAPLREFTKVSGAFIGRILRVGTPTAASHLIWTSVFPLLTTIITLFGMAPLAGMTIGHRFESIAYFTCVGFSIATATVVGKRVGAGDFDGAKRAAYESRRLVSYFLVPASLLFIFAPEFLIALVSDDPAVIATGAAYLRCVGLLEIFLGWEMVFEGGFNGLGNTRPYMMVSIPLTLGRYPAAWMLVHWGGFGVESVYWCIAISTLLKGTAMAWMFRRTSAERLTTVEHPSART